VLSSIFIRTEGRARKRSVYRDFVFLVVAVAHTASDSVSLLAGAPGGDLLFLPVSESEGGVRRRSRSTTATVFGPRKVVEFIQGGGGRRKEGSEGNYTADLRLKSDAGRKWDS